MGMFPGNLTQISCALMRNTVQLDQHAGILYGVVVGVYMH
jgi:tetrahydromethanopterin S-methyltransferase subunit G